MNKESLYENALLYQEKTLDDLWAMFADKTSKGEIAKNTLLHAFEIKGIANAKEQYDFLCSLLNMDFIELGLQESHSREFKSSFYIVLIHSVQNGLISTSRYLERLRHLPTVIKLVMFSWE